MVQLQVGGMGLSVLRGGAPSETLLWTTLSSWETARHGGSDGKKKSFGLEVTKSDGAVLFFKMKKKSAVALAKAMQDAALSFREAVKREGGRSVEASDTDEGTDDSEH